MARLSLADTGRSANFRESLSLMVKERKERASDTLDDTGDAKFKNGEKSRLSDKERELEADLGRKMREEDQQTSADDHAKKLHGFGVTWEWLFQFTEAHDCWGWKTWQVVNKIIKPATKIRRCRYAELESVTNRPALIFVSHCWSANWGDLVMAICSNAKSTSQTVWIDIFAVRQWPPNEADLCFRKIIPKCKLVLVVLSTDKFYDYCRDNRRAIVTGETQKKTKESNKDITYVQFINENEESEERRKDNPFFRLWCVVEMSTAVHVGVPVVLQAGRLNKTDEGYQFHSRDDFEITTCMLDTLADMVRIEDAECTFDTDKELQMRKIEEEDGGAEKVNRTLEGIVGGAVYAHKKKQVDHLIHIFAENKNVGMYESKNDLLSVACGSGYTKLIKDILEEENSIDRTEPLRYAAQEGQTSIIKLLLEALTEEKRKKYLTAVGINKFSLLGSACAFNRIETARYLVIAGAKMNSDELVAGLKKACEEGLIDVVAILLSLAAKRGPTYDAVKKLWKPRKRSATIMYHQGKQQRNKCFNCCYFAWKTHRCKKRLSEEQNSRRQNSYRRDTVIETNETQIIIQNKQPIENAHDEWRDNDKSGTCEMEGCDLVFNERNMRNHCRSCAKLVCENCISRKSVTMVYCEKRYKNQIVCNGCIVPDKHHCWDDLNKGMKDRVKKGLLGAAKGGKTEELARLLLLNSERYDANFELEGQTLLGVACMSGYCETIRLLLVLGAETRKKSSSISYTEDFKSRVCEECKKVFGLGHRRHHCRFCGRLLCNECTRVDFRVDNIRACETCYRRAKKKKHSKLGNGLEARQYSFPLAIVARKYIVNGSISHLDAFKILTTEVFKQDNSGSHVTDVLENEVINTISGEEIDQGEGGGASNTGNRLKKKRHCVLRETAKEFQCKLPIEDDRGVESRWNNCLKRLLSSFTRTGPSALQANVSRVSEHHGQNRGRTASLL
jgi:hypothetical protein